MSGEVIILCQSQSIMLFALCLSVSLAISAAVATPPNGEGFNDPETDPEEEIQPYQEVVCGNGTVIDLTKVEEFYWVSPERTDGGWGYPPNTE